MGLISMGTLILFHPVTVLTNRGEFNKGVTTAAESINKTITTIIINCSDIKRSTLFSLINVLELVWTRNIALAYESLLHIIV